MNMLNTLLSADLTKYAMVCISVCISVAQGALIKVATKPRSRPNSTMPERRGRDKSRDRGKHRKRRAEREPEDKKERMLKDLLKAGEREREKGMQAAMEERNIFRRFPRKQKKEVRRLLQCLLFEVTVGEQPNTTNRGPKGVEGNTREEAELLATGKPRAPRLARPRLARTSPPRSPEETSEDAHRRSP